jgi:DNA-binding NtrC family response regulator
MSLLEELSFAATDSPFSDRVYSTRTAKTVENVGVSAQEYKSKISQPRLKVLVVDDNSDEMFVIQRSFKGQNYDVVSATSVEEAIKLIVTQRFDVLITDLHMPAPGDGFTVVSAMRHLQPAALTLVASDYPDVQRAMNAILLEADDVLLKPFNVNQIAGFMDRRKRAPKGFSARTRESVASILDRDLVVLTRRWLSRVEEVKELAAIPLAAKERTAYLPEIIRTVTKRLRVIREIEAIDNPCAAAVVHGQFRSGQGYTAPMIVQESRILQVCIFETIQRNLSTVDFSVVLPDIMIIADEVDSQLKQTLQSFLSMQKK